jgi:hypothetical protein
MPRWNTGDRNDAGPFRASVLRIVSLPSRPRGTRNRFHETRNTKHQTPNTKHQTPNTKHRTPNTAARCSNNSRAQNPAISSLKNFLTDIRQTHPQGRQSVANIATPASRARREKVAFLAPHARGTMPRRPDCRSPPRAQSRPTRNSVLSQPLEPDEQNLSRSGALSRLPEGPSEPRSFKLA